jgi:hypothetical protein
MLAVASQHPGTSGPAGGEDGLRLVRTMWACIDGEHHGLNLELVNEQAILWSVAGGNWVPPRTVLRP